MRLLLKTAKLTAILLLTGCILVAATGCSMVSRKKMPSSFLAHCHTAVWSKDGRYLFYNDNKLRRYDTVTEKKYSYPKSLDIGIYDFSADMRSMVFQDYNADKPCEVGIADVSTSRKRVVYYPKGRAQSIYWLPKDRIVLRLYQSSYDYGKESYSVVILDDKGSVLTSIPDANLQICSYDGTGLIYVDKHSKYHYYNISSGKHIKLPINQTVEFIYLSSKQLVYTFYAGNNRSICESVSLSQFKKTPIDLYYESCVISISPSLTHFAVAILSHGELGIRDELHIHPMLDEATKKMREIERGL